MDMVDEGLAIGELSEARSDNSAFVCHLTELSGTDLIRTRFLGEEKRQAWTPTEGRSEMRVQRLEG